MINRPGFGSILMTVVDRMGGDLERRLEGLASAWKTTDLAPLNTSAVEWIAELIRTGIQPVGAIGSFLGQKPLVPVMQWSIIKS
ncbi:hypothetical protein [Microcoleus vaginatus]|uniref:hypothetical protein n=1 Tax=Microcoleus vaginatus TaxID=119532 RepID=UPI001F600DBB|nr:hypothetical protein D0A37_07585 [Microcoleus vaginatus HSN003]